jgi:3-deoxy-D-manno-octulosonic-acid transferase
VIRGRPHWLAANTVHGEEEVIARLHTAVAASLPRLLTVVAPEDSGRAPDIAGMLVAQWGLRVGLWTAIEASGGCLLEGVGVRACCALTMQSFHWSSC